MICEISKMPHACELSVSELDLVAGGDTSINFGNGFTLNIYASGTTSIEWPGGMYIVTPKSMGKKG